MTGARRITRNLPGLWLAMVVSSVGCAERSQQTGRDSTDSAAEADVSAVPTSTRERPGIQASNAFYYYRDVDTAWEFYRDVMGFETVVDYGFAKILRVAESSYLTLVDAEQGMHSADEPKSVTLALVTEQLEDWHTYLTTVGVPMRGELKVTEGSAHDGFVAIDPEGYLLEVERFNAHAENVALMPQLSGLTPIGPTQGGRPEHLRVQATVFWLYYRDVPRMQAFYEQVLGSPLVVDQGWAKVYRVAGSGYIGLVDGERGLHSATEDKGVTLSFFTDEVDEWFASHGEWDGFELRTPEITNESDRVRVFVGYDPENYFLEWDTFLDLPDNEVLLNYLRRE